MPGLNYVRSINFVFREGGWRTWGALKGRRALINVNKYGGSKGRVCRVDSERNRRRFSLISRAKRNRWVHRPFIYNRAKISHLATKRSDARGASKPVWRTQKRFFFTAELANIFYISVFQGRATRIHVQGRFKQRRRLFASISRSVISPICQTWSRVSDKVEPDEDIQSWFFYQFIEYLQSSCRAKS